MPAGAQPRGELGTGAYRQGMVRRKGGLAVMTGSVRPSLSTIFLADGREVWITLALAT